MSENETTPASGGKGFPWLSCFGITALLLLLIVIALFPLFSDAVSAVRDNAKRTEAKGEIMQILAALKAYATTYGAPPKGSSTRIMIVLRGANPRGIIFFETDPKKFNAAGALLDPWGTPYRIDTFNAAFPWAYSFGKDAVDDGGAPGTDDIASWQ